ncbi:MAG: hypothetical protein D3909_11115, partial [Candidatus Electrothrix sp. ATG1]|nr:hypothetical protein [Candidatus Electrothrix sp. ATG1]
LLTMGTLAMIKKDDVLLRGNSLLVCVLFGKRDTYAETAEEENEIFFKGIAEDFLQPGWQRKKRCFFHETTSVKETFFALSLRLYYTLQGMVLSKKLDLSSLTRHCSF